MVETTREEVEEDKRSRRVFGGDLVREIARTVWRCVRIDDSTDIPGRVAPLKEDVINYLEVLYSMRSEKWC